MWSYIIDGLLILILIVCLITGIVKGFFDSILSLIGTGLALAVSVFTAKYVANFFNKLFNFEEFILGKLEGESISIFGNPYNTTEVAKFCVWICAVVIMFVIIKLAIYILSKIFESVTKNSPTVSGINRVLGMIFGIVKGGVLVLASLALCSVISQVPGIGKSIYTEITNTKITSQVFKYVDEFVEKNLTKDKIQDIIDRVKGEISKDSDDNSSDEEVNGESGNNKIEAHNYYIEYIDVTE